MGKLHKMKNWSEWTFYGKIFNVESIEIVFWSEIF